MSVNGPALQARQELHDRGDGHVELAPRTTGSAALLNMLPMARPYRGLLTGAVLCVLAGAFLDLAPPLVVKQVVDGNLAHGDPDGLLQLGLIYFVATAALQGTTF